MSTFDLFTSPFATDGDKPKLPEDVSCPSKVSAGTR